MKYDVNFGMLVSNLAMYFIILSAGTVLYASDHSIINTVEDASIALKPLTGKFTYLVCSLGVLGVSFLSIPVLAGCIGYFISEF